MFPGLQDFASGSYPCFPGLPLGRLAVGNPSLFSVETLSVQRPTALKRRAPPEVPPVATGLIYPTARQQALAQSRLRPGTTGPEWKAWWRAFTHGPLAHPTAAKSLFFVPVLQETNDAICVLKEPWDPRPPQGSHLWDLPKVLTYKMHLLQD